MEHARPPAPRGAPPSGPCRALGVPDRYADYHVSADAPSRGGLVVHTPSTRAVAAALRALHAAGGSALVYGPRGGGKTFVVQQLLGERAANVPTSPAQVGT